MRIYQEEDDMDYTPGPWTIDHQRIGPPGEPVALLCDVNDPMTGTVIDWPRGNDSGTAMSIDDAENEANARLIASAPDLLEACEVANRFFEENDDFTDGEYPIPGFILDMRIAIKKATGRCREEVS
jgi:hypothetical protein